MGSTRGTFDVLFLLHVDVVEGDARCKVVGLNRLRQAPAAKSTIDVIRSLGASPHYGTRGHRHEVSSGRRIICHAPIGKDRYVQYRCFDHHG